MNPDSENFDSLRQLLALKRHEVPPPGYFDRFSRDVMARIKAGDAGDELGAEASWLRRFLGMFDVKPVFAGAFGTVMCAFLISGILSSDRTSVMAVGTPAEGGNPVLGGNQGKTDVAFGQPFPSANSNSMAGGSLFDQFSAQTGTAGFHISGGN